MICLYSGCRPSSFKKLVNTHYLANVAYTLHHLSLSSNILIGRRSGIRNLQSRRSVTFSEIFSPLTSPTSPLCVHWSPVGLCVFVCMFVWHVPSPSSWSCCINLSFFSLYTLSSSVAAWKCSTCGESLSARPHQIHGTGSGHRRLGSSGVVILTIVTRLSLVHSLLYYQVCALFCPVTDKWRIL